MKDKIYISKPVNKLAALVVGSQPNDETDNNNYGQIYMSLIKPPLIPFRGDNRFNLIGVKIGKLTVIGVFIKQTKGHKLKWVVLCLCGYYTIRTNYTLKRKIKNKEYDECKRCNMNNKTHNLDY